MTHRIGGFRWSDTKWPPRRVESHVVGVTRYEVSLNWLVPGESRLFRSPSRRLFQFQSITRAAENCTIDTGRFAAPRTKKERRKKQRIEAAMRIEIEERDTAREIFIFVLSQQDTIHLGDCHLVCVIESKFCMLTYRIRETKRTSTMTVDGSYIFCLC